MQPIANIGETGGSRVVRTLRAMTDTKNLYAWKWIDGHGANRPMMPSEARTTTEGVKRYLPWARADMDQPRPLLPWEHRTGNDWRGIKAS